MAVRSLWSRKLRSSLTILGVIIGIGSVLAVVTLGDSFKAQIVGEFDDLDRRSVFVTLTQAGSGGGPPNAGAFSSAFTSRDVAELAALPHVADVVPEAEIPITSLRAGNRTLLFNAVTATTASSASVRDPEAYANGTAFPAGGGGIVLGDTVARLLGNGSAPPIGDAIEIRMTGNASTVVRLSGVLAADDSLFGFGNSAVYVSLADFPPPMIASPVTGAPVLLYSGLTIVADSAGDLTQVRDEARAYLQGDSSDARRVLPDTIEIAVATQEDIAESISSLFDQVTLFVAAIAVVSLLVGAIGIANIMLVSVTERTREIGVIKALGATNRQVMMMFIVESTLVGLVGGLLGVALGLGAGTLLVTALFSAPLSIPTGWIAISVLVGLAVGTVAGYSPARRATRIEIVQALAYE